LGGAEGRGGMLDAGAEMPWKGQDLHAGAGVIFEVLPTMIR